MDSSSTYFFLLNSFAFIEKKNYFCIQFGKQDASNPILKSKNYQLTTKNKHLI